MIQEFDDKVVVTLDSDPSTSVTVLKHGATVLSWKLHGKEQLWLSEAAKLDGSKPVRGGIPLVFPVFGKSKVESHPTYPLPQHGFARSSPWEFLGQTTESPLTVQFGLGPENADKDILAKWNGGAYDFTLIYSLSLSEEALVTKIEVENHGKDAFDFNWLFHTYFRVDDITDIVVNNLVDADCYDQLLQTWYTEKAPMINFTEEFDRIYKHVDTRKIFQIIRLGKVEKNVARDNLPDVVVWNPWTEKSAGMSDFEPKSGFHNMLCIEAGHVTDFIKLEPDHRWSGSQTLTVGGEIKVQTNIY